MKTGNLFAKDEPSNHARGLAAEATAQEYLKKRGFDVLETRYKTKYGEVDIIAVTGEILCFIEVKKRAKNADALASVSVSAQRRIENAALYFLSQNPEHINAAMRFDVVAISDDGHITHLDNAWEARS